jgi:hypothetical protein
MPLLELSLLITAVIGGCTICIVKVVSQLENSRCTEVLCCGIECKRDLTHNVREVKI